MPVVPMHERCPLKLTMSAGADPDEREPAPKPFAVLAGLKRGGEP